MGKEILNNKWFRGAIPALLIHSCIGSVYCWSLLKDEIATSIGCSVTSIEICFSLAIFFLGMSAAFGGSFVEKNVKKSSLLSTICFVSGLVLSIIAIYFKSRIGLILSYGCLMGIGLGIGYLSPVKTLMLWFSEHKGLATGIAISGFGLSKVIFSPFIEWCNLNMGVEWTLGIISGVSIILMGLATYYIKKPDGWVEPIVKTHFRETLKIFKNKTYRQIWFVFYLNITCGLALISFEKAIGLYSGLTNIGILATLTAFFNTVGRFGYSTASDFMKNKAWVYVVIFLSSSLTLVFGTFLPLVIPMMLCIVNAGYGGGFSTLPTLIQSHFGMNNISTLHGLTLSAWAFAGLSGNQLSNFIINIMGLSYNALFMILFVLYSIGLFYSFRIKQKFVDLE
jgi:OFA family oxalate/formate antiporter-like MFS transporter